MSKTKGKTYVEIYGEKKAAELIEKRRLAILGDKNPSKREEVRKINSEKNKGKKSWCKGLTKETNNSLLTISKKLKNKPKSKEHIEKIKKINIGRKSWSKGLTKENNEILNSISKKLTGRKRPDAREYMLNGGSSKANLVPRNPAKMKILSEKTRKRMLNGQASIMLSKVKNPSKPQINLFKIIQELFPSAILNFPIIKVNKNVDIIIPEYKIIIEYDGSYWHQDKEKDLERQKIIEELGYKFIRYDGGKNDTIPKKEKIKIDIDEIIKRE